MSHGLAWLVWRKILLWRKIPLSSMTCMSLLGCYWWRLCWEYVLVGLLGLGLQLFCFGVMSFSCVLCNLLSQELVSKNVLVKLFWVFCFKVTLWRKCVGFGKGFVWGYVFFGWTITGEIEENWKLSGKKRIGEDIH